MNSPPKENDGGRTVWVLLERKLNLKWRTGESDGITAFSIPYLFMEVSQHLSLRQDYPWYALVLQTPGVDPGWVLKVSALIL